MSRDNLDSLRDALAAGHYEKVIEDGASGGAEAGLYRSRALTALGRNKCARSVLENEVKTDREWRGAGEVELALLDLVENRCADVVRSSMCLLLKNEKRELTRAGALLALGIAENRLGRPEQARTRLFDALACYERRADRDGRAKALLEIGITFSWTGNESNANLYCTLALADWASLSNRIAMGRALAALGRIHLEAGRFQYALDLFKRVSSLLLKRLDTRSECRLKINEGQCLVGLGKSTEAIFLFKEAEQFASELEDDYLITLSLREQCGAWIDQGKADNATQILDQLDSSVDPDPYSYDRIALEHCRARLQLACGDQEVISKLETVATRFAQRDLAVPEIQTRQLLALAKSRRDDVFEAERQLTTAYRIAKKKGLARYVRELKFALGAMDMVEGSVYEWDRPVSRQAEMAGDGYLVREVLGRGAFGTVYRALDLEHAREVALKRLDLGSAYDADAYERLVSSVRSELDSASRVLHPGVARIYGVNRSHDGTVYIVQELVPGKSLRHHMNASCVAPDLKDVAPVLADIAHALSALHAQGVVHRDLKPENVMLGRDGRPVLIDFGIAQTDAAAKHTVAGTPGYMAPEQVRGDLVDARADIYSLGIIAYEWLAGEKPGGVSGASSWLRIDWWLRNQQIVLRRIRPDLPRAVCNLITKMVRAAPGRRPATANSVASQFEQIQLSD